MCLIINPVQLWQQGQVNGYEYQAGDALAGWKCKSHMMIIYNHNHYNDNLFPLMVNRFHEGLGNNEHWSDYAYSVLTRFIPQHLRKMSVSCIWKWRCECIDVQQQLTYLTCVCILLFYHLILRVTLFIRRSAELPSIIMYVLYRAEKSLYTRFSGGSSVSWRVVYSQH